MKSGLTFFDRLLLPFYSPKKIATILSLMPSEEAIITLKSLPPAKSLSIVNNWSEKTRVFFLNSLGSYGIKLLRAMPAEEQSGYLLKLNSKMVRKFGVEIPDKKLSEMMASWDEKDLPSIFGKLPQAKAAKLFKQLPLNQQVRLITTFKPWIGASLMEGLRAEARAVILDQIDSKVALDMFDRLSRHIKGDVLSCLSSARRLEIAGAMSATRLAEVIKHWKEERAGELFAALDVEQRVALAMHLPDNLCQVIFIKLPYEGKLEVIKELEPAKGAPMLAQLDKKEREAVLSQLHPGLADPLRKLMIM